MKFYRKLLMQLLCKNSVSSKHLFFFVYITLLYTLVSILLLCRSLCLDKDLYVVHPRSIVKYLNLVQVCLLTVRLRRRSFMQLCSKILLAFSISIPRMQSNYLQLLTLKCFPSYQLLRFLFERSSQVLQRNFT